MPSTTKKKTVKRQPAKSRLSSSSSRVKKPAVKKAAPKKGVAKKTPAKKAVATKTRTRAKARTTKLHIPLGRYGSLSLQVSHKAAPKNRKKKPTAQRSAMAKAIIAITFMGIGLLFSLYFGIQVFAADSQPVRESYRLITPVALEPTTPSLPRSAAVRLRIPDIAVDAPVVSIGKNPDGSMEVPGDASEVGSYKYAPTPGEIGPAIITGHVDSISGPAVFWRLRELKPNQLIHVKRADKTTATFRIDSVKEYPQDSFPTNFVYGNVDYAGLRLITCSGSFNLASRHYSTNLVVFARLVD